MNINDPIKSHLFNRFSITKILIASFDLGIIQVEHSIF